MATKRQSGQVDIDRRKVIMLGLAGASALFVGGGRSVLAEDQGKLERKVFKEAQSMIPGFPKVRLRAITYQPGASSKDTMKNSMICECTQGPLEITQDDGKPFTAKKGDIWTCKTGTVEQTVNKGKTAGVMRVMDLLTE
jgi:quercetin dioxygenase-like cupin family protein